MSMILDHKMKPNPKKDAWAHSNNIAHDGSRKHIQNSIGFSGLNVPQGIGAAGENCKTNTKIEYRNQKSLSRSASAQVSFRGFSNLAEKARGFLFNEIMSITPNLVEVDRGKIARAINEIRTVSGSNAGKFVNATKNFDEICSEKNLKYIDSDTINSLISQKAERDAARVSSGTADNKAIFYKIPKNTFTKRVFEAFMSPVRLGQRIVRYFTQMPVINEIKNYAGIVTKEDGEPFEKFLNHVYKKGKLSKDSKATYAEWLRDQLKAAKNKEEAKKIFETEQKEYKHINNVYNSYSNLIGFVDSIEAWQRVYKNKYGTSNIPEKVLQGKILRRLPKQVDEQKAKYSTALSAPLTRIVSGVIAGYFLSMDNYNMTRLLKDDPGEATKEGIARAGQETARVSLETYMNSFGFGLFKEQIDRSMKTALSTNVVITMFSNLLSRKLMDKPVFLITAKQAEEIVQNEQNKKEGGLGTALGHILSGKKLKSSSTQVTTNSQPAKISFTGAVPNKNFIKEISLKLKNSFIKLVTDPKDFYRPAQRFTQEQLDTILNNIDDKPLVKTFEAIIEKAEKEADGTVILGRKDSMWKTGVDAIFAPIEFVHKKVKGMPGFIENITPKMFKAEKYRDKAIKEGLQKEYEIARDEIAKELSEKKDSLTVIYNAARKVLDDNKDTTKQDIIALQKIFNYLNANKDKNGVGSELINKLEGALGFKGTDYDSSKFQVANVNLARIITGLFITADAYNLAMEYTKGDTKVANEKAKKRALQEVCRIILAGYIINLTTKLTKGWQNAFLPANLLVVAVNNIFNEIVARKTVGQPITPKSRDEMIIMEEKAHNSKNPLNRFFAKVMGKKSLASQAGLVSEGEIRQSKYATSFTRLDPVNAQLFGQFDLNKKLSHNA